MHRASRESNVRHGVFSPTLDFFTLYDLQQPTLRAIPMPCECHVTLEKDAVMRTVRSYMISMQRSILWDGLQGPVQSIVGEIKYSLQYSKPIQPSSPSNFDLIMLKNK